MQCLIYGTYSEDGNEKIIIKEYDKTYEIDDGIEGSYLESFVEMIKQLAMMLFSIDLIIDVKEENESND